MSSNYITDAINIKSYNLSEADKIVVMYSKEKGLMRGVAKGTKKTKSKLGGRMDMFVANKLMLFKGKNLDTICQAEALNTFSNLRNDMDKMLYAMYMAEVVHNFGTEDDPNSTEIYEIFYKALERLSQTKNLVEIHLCVMRFQLKMMQVCGYELQLKNCVKCSCELGAGEHILSLEKGGFQCLNCATGSGIRFPDKLRAFLITLEETDFFAETMYDEKATEKVSGYCLNLLKSYVESHCSAHFKTAKMLV